MKHEIVTLENVQIIGMAKEIPFCKGEEECPKFWGEYMERIVKPVYFEHKTPNAFQQAAIDNGIGEFGLCSCDIPNHNCATCSEMNFTACNTKTFTYVIGGKYKGGNVPEGMNLFPIHSGKWLKMHFEGGMKAFQQQYQMFYKEWLPQHPEFHCPNNAMTMEWYNGTDIDSPDYQCGVMIPLEEILNNKNKMIGYCGINCEKCEARIATIDDDDKMREEVSRKWCELFHTDMITPDKINCTGCKGDGVKYFFCNQMCKIKPCVTNKGYESCGECPNMNICEILAEEIGNNEDAKNNLKTTRHY
ncbi:MAG: DUF3795 domain-containing protein [Bacteroidaceae bacterium]|nr:DUF3795 domain-containing protein [Bacteroidaceae bacterium]